MANEVLKPQTVKVLLEKKKAEVMDRPQKAAIKQVERTAHSTSWTAQLREKTASSAELHSMALQLSVELNAVGVKQIINARIDVMFESRPRNENFTG